MTIEKHINPMGKASFCFIHIDGCLMMMMMMITAWLILIFKRNYGIIYQYYTLYYVWLRYFHNKLTDNTLFERILCIDPRLSN